MPEFNATLVIVIISFVVFMLAMKAIYFDPILKIKAEREQKLQDDRTSAQRFAEAFDRLQADYESGLKQARKEAHQVIQEIRQKAKTDAQKALLEARTLAQTETDRQMAELHNWRETTYQQLESERTALKQAVIAKVTSGHKIRTTSGG
jgi:F-type H+-transporting ATPase subunit b